MMSLEIGTFAGVGDILGCSLGIIYCSWIEAGSDKSFPCLHPSFSILANLTNRLETLCYLVPAINSKSRSLTIDNYTRPYSLRLSGIIVFTAMTSDKICNIMM